MSEVKVPEEASDPNYVNPRAGKSREYLELLDERDALRERVQWYRETLPEWEDRVKELEGRLSQALNSHARLVECLGAAADRLEGLYLCESDGGRLKHPLKEWLSEARALIKEARHE